MKATEEDRGIVERPVLAPHFAFHATSEDAVLLVSATGTSELRGRLYPDLMPLLDGTRSRHEVADALDGRHSALAVQTALVSLARRALLVSAEHGMDRGAAAFWSAHGATPRWAEQRLRSVGISVSGGDGGLEASLREIGLVVGPDEPTLYVLVAGDYLLHTHEEANRRFLASGAPWTVVAPEGDEALFGPVFRPADGGPCWACLAQRLRGNRETENFLRAAGRSPGDVARTAPRPFGRAALDLAATQIALWIVLGETAPLHAHAISLAVSGHAMHHPIQQRPQCPACGDVELRRPDRDPAPIALRPVAKRIRNGGGYRAVAPIATIHALRRQVSHVSGVIRQFRRLTDPTDPYVFVYESGSNLALHSKDLRLLRNSLRGNNSGKGDSLEQAEASALCEAVERYSGVFQGDEIRRRARFADFADGEAIHPGSVQLFSDRQHAEADALNVGGRFFNHVPPRFDPDVAMDWSPVWSLSAKCHRWLPTSMLYFAAPPADDGIVYAPPDSNGCAAGNAVEEAILQGFLELVERDAFACWWYNRVQLPELDLESFGDAWLAGLCSAYRETNRDIWVLDATSDLDIPVFVAVSRRTDKAAEDLIYSAGAHLDPVIALLRAVTELNQYFALVRDANEDSSGYRADAAELVAWWRGARLADHSWLAPKPGTRRRTANDYPAPATTDFRQDIERCLETLDRHGLELLVLDQTRPDIGLPVVRTIVPGLRHFWARFAPGRLYDVPVRMGWRETSTPETDLNPVEIII